MLFCRSLNLLQNSLNINRLTEVASDVLAEAFHFNEESAVIA